MHHTNLTPTELNRLHTEGSVRVVRKCEPQPTGFYHGEPVFAQPMNEPYQRVNPFPPAGTREVIDGEDCVWGEAECKLFEEVVDTQFVKVFNKLAVSNEPFGISRIQRECCLGYTKASRNLEAMLSHGLAKQVAMSSLKFRTVVGPIDAGVHCFTTTIRKDETE